MPEGLCWAGEFGERVNAKVGKGGSLLEGGLGGFEGERHFAGGIKLGFVLLVRGIWREESGGGGFVLEWAGCAGRENLG